MLISLISKTPEATANSSFTVDLVSTAKSLIKACEDLMRQLPEHSANQSTLLDFYLTYLREADRLQRELEQAITDYVDEHGLLIPVISKARNQYRQLTEKVQILFTKQLTDTGWPPQGRLYNANVFDEMVAVAQYAASELSGELRDPDGGEIGESGVEKIRQQITDITELFHRAGIVPGSEEALRLF